MRTFATHKILNSQLVGWRMVWCEVLESAIKSRMVNNSISISRHSEQNECEKDYNQNGEKKICLKFLHNIFIYKYLCVLPQ